MSGARKSSDKTSGEKKTSVTSVDKKEGEEKASSKTMEVISGEKVVLGGVRKLSEPLKVIVDKKNMPAGLPPIDMNELANVLRNPNMPSHKLMKEVADKIVCVALDNNTRENSMPEMKNLFDCILEASLSHEESEDEEDEEGHEPIVRRIPCKICNKVFGSTMKMNTHMLVAHPREESAGAEQQEKPGRKRSNSILNQSESRAKKLRHPSKSEDPKVKPGEENHPAVRRSSISRYQAKVTSGASILQSGDDLEKSKVDPGKTGAYSKINEPQESTAPVSTTTELSQSVKSSQRIPGKNNDKEEQNLSANVDSVSGCEVEGPAIKKQRLEEKSQKDISTSSSEDLSSQASSSVIKSSSAKSENNPQEKTPENSRTKRSSRRI